MDEDRKIREKFPRFRALIIGRPNAGKTTILRRIAQSADGRVDPSQGRGVHNIADELTFKSNPGFVFHDSPGMEAGSMNEMESIQSFISERANARSLRKKLHAIWYCIPTDNARLAIAAEEKFFDKINPNGVPVILVFTKFESREAQAFRKLRENCSDKDALLKAPAEARQTFEKEHLSEFMSRKYPPAGTVYLKRMDNENAQCLELIDMTLNALNTETLRWLLATVQKVNMKLQMGYMLKRHGSYI